MNHNLIKRIGRKISLLKILEPKPLFYDIFQSERIAEYAWIIEKLDLEKGGSVLDVGCCGSLFSIMLASLGYKVTGLDLGEYAWKHPNFTFIHGDINNPPNSLLCQKFDRIVSVSVLEHVGLFPAKTQDLEGDIKAIKQMGKLLNERGKLLLTLPYGKFNTIVRWRIYDAKRLNELSQRFKVENKEFFMEKDGIWISVAEDDVKNLTYTGYPAIGDKCRGIVCIKLSKGKGN